MTGFFGKEFKLKVAFFQKLGCIAPQKTRKLSWKRDLEIVFSLESADSNYTAVSEGGKFKIQSLGWKEAHFWPTEIIPIFFWEYWTFTKEPNKVPSNLTSADKSLVFLAPTMLQTEREKFITFTPSWDGRNSPQTQKQCVR